MERLVIDLNSPEGKAQVKGVLRHATGYIPGEPNEGLISQIEGSPARLLDYDDSGWEICKNIKDKVSIGFTFAWWRITVTLPEELEGMKLAGSNCVFETNVDNYGEIFVDGEIDLVAGTVVGFNAQQRVVVNPSVVPGTKHVIAVLAANGPFGVPRGGIFLRYATLAFETRGG